MELVFAIRASVLFLGQREKHQEVVVLLHLNWVVFFFLTPEITSDGLGLPFATDDDLLERSRRLVPMVETPIRVPSVVLVSWKNDPVDCKKIVLDY